MRIKALTRLDKKGFIYGLLQIYLIPIQYEVMPNQRGQGGVASLWGKVSPTPLSRIGCRLTFNWCDVAKLDSTYYRDTAKFRRYP